MSSSARADLSVVFIEAVRRRRKLVQHSLRMSLPTARPDRKGPPLWDCARRSGDVRQRPGATPHGCGDVPQQRPGGQPGLGSEAY